WLPQTKAVSSRPSSDDVSVVASYIANRVKFFNLGDDPAADLVRDNQHKGYEELAGLLGKAYGSGPASAFRRPRLQKRLAEQACPVPTLVDAKMRLQEWVHGAGSLLKTDFEHHAMGKRELEMSDPAYDLADAILQFKMSEEDERK